MTDGDVNNRNNPVPHFSPTGALAPNERNTRYELEDLVPHAAVVPKVQSRWKSVQIARAVVHSAHTLPS
eukprot:5045850-Lingulodinium_polyedra.AAC.1